MTDNVVDFADRRAERHVKRAEGGEVCEYCEHVFTAGDEVIFDCEGLCTCPVAVGAISGECFAEL